MKQLIVPVDFSQDSITAVRTAVWMARQLEAEIILVHINKIKSFPSIFTRTRTHENPEDIEQSFQELIHNTEHNGVKIEYAIRNGSVDGEIVKFAEEVNPYMIIMGTHGASGRRELMAGSNSFKVVSHASWPVITMRGFYHGNGINRIVMPIDTTHTSRHKVPFTLELAQQFNAEIHVLAASMNSMNEFVVKAQNYAVQVCNYLDNFNVRYVMDTVIGDNITNITLDYAKKVNADLISIMTEQEISVSNMFIGPYAQQMIHHSPIPVLSMHKNPRLDGDFSIM